jgi:hypothetical protein
MTLQEWFKDKILVNYKTTIVGLVGFAAVSIAGNPSHFPPIVVSIAQILAGTSILGLGAVGNDRLK